MKTSKTLMLALAVAVATVAGNVTAQSLKLNVSGTVKLQNAYGDYKGTVSAHSFNEKDVYLLISNAVANAETGYATNLPKDGYIVFDPNGYDSMVNGTFYVTNKEGVYYPLSGYDTEETPEYYSFIELDTIIYYIGDDDQLDYGWYWDDEDEQIFQGVDNYNLNQNTLNGSDTSTSKALLFIHDNPYEYADSNFEDDEGYYAFYYNDNALEIGGILTAHFNIQDADIDSGSFSLNGTGNFYIDALDDYGVVSSGHASFNK